MDVARLRSETRPEHEAVEAAMPLMDPALTVDTYVAVLQTLYCLLLSWEDFAAQHAPARLARMVQGRRRAPLLAADLNHFGVALPTPGMLPVSEFPERLTTDAAFLGAMYVIEGSTLGGQLLARHLAEHFHTSFLSNSSGLAYFRGAGEHTGSLWREFQAELIALPESEADTTIAAAQAMFSLFRRTLLRAATPAASPSSTVL